MARSTFRFTFKSFDETEKAINSLLITKNYKTKLENGETVWYKGLEFPTGAKTLKIEYSERVVTIYAWISTGFSEMDLSGIAAMLQKKQLLNVVTQIKALIQ